MQCQPVEAEQHHTAKGDLGMLFKLFKSLSPKIQTLNKNSRTITQELSKVEYNHFM